MVYSRSLARCAAARFRLCCLHDSGAGGAAAATVIMIDAPRSRPHHKRSLMYRVLFLNSWGGGEWKSCEFRAHVLRRYFAINGVGDDPKTPIRQWACHLASHCCRSPHLLACLTSLASLIYLPAQSHRCHVFVPPPPARGQVEAKRCTPHHQASSSPPQRRAQGGPRSQDYVARSAQQGVVVVQPTPQRSKRQQSANAGKALVTLQSLGLANVKKEVADMSPLQVARQVSNLIVETALSILSGKGARFGSKPWQRCPQLMYDVLQVSATRSRAARRLTQCTLRRLVALSSKVRRAQLRFITQLKTCAHCRQTRRQSGYLATRPPSGRQPSQRV